MLVRVSRAGIAGSEADFENAVFAAGIAPDSETVGALGRLVRALCVLSSASCAASSSAVAAITSRGISVQLACDAAAVGASTSTLLVPVFTGESSSHGSGLSPNILRMYVASADVDACR